MSRYLQSRQIFIQFTEFAKLGSILKRSRLLPVTWWLSGKMLACHTGDHTIKSLNDADFLVTEFIEFNGNNLG